MAGLLGCTPAGGSAVPHDAAPSQAASTGKKPNIVFVLTDDLSMNLLKYLPAVQKMSKDGTTFSNYYVTDSLCCPSRSSIFTGRYPHSTGVFTNLGPDGGYPLFKGKHLDEDTFATDLQTAGYRTSMMGKLMNGYQPGTPAAPAQDQVPKGWNEWTLAGNAYGEYNYNLNQNGTVVHHGKKPKDYLTDVMSGRGQDFIKRSAAEKQPFMLEIATFAPHGPATPAPRDKKLFPNLKVPRTKLYGAKTKNAPSWLKAMTLTAKDTPQMDAAYRRRIRSIQAVGDMVTKLRGQLRASGVADNTYLVFSSDNGFHLGEHSMPGGKQTAFDSDINVPLVVVGPDVPKGHTTDAMASNIDLRATFDAIAGIHAPATVDGQSLAPLLSSPARKPTPRDFVLVEHHGPDTDPRDPDHPGKKAANPPSYEAIRSHTFLYVKYVDGEREYYDTAKDPRQLDNIVGSLSRVRVRELDRLISRAQSCSGQSGCARAQQLSTGTGT